MARYAQRRRKSGKYMESSFEKTIELFVLARHLSKRNVMRNLDMLITEYCI